MTTEVDSFLAHYGVKGMRWGIRKKFEAAVVPATNVMDRVRVHNLKVNTSNAATIRARIEKSNVRMSEINSEMAKINSGKKSLKSINRKYDLANERQVLEKSIKRDTKDTAKEPTSGMTSTQKKLLIGVGVVAALGVAAVLINNKDEISAFGRTNITKAKTGDIFKKNDVFKNASSPDDVFNNVVHGANPGYKGMGGKMNCRRATFAYEMRRRGYDVSATTSSIGKGQNETGLVNALIVGDKNIKTRQSLSSFVKSSASPSAAIRTRAVVKDARKYAADTAAMDFDSGWGYQPKKYIDKMTEAFASQPNGARGEIAFNMKGYVHSMQYEIFDGKPHIFDSQKAAHYPLTEQGFFNLMNKWTYPLGATLTRLDNVELDTKFIAQWVK